MKELFFQILDMSISASWLVLAVVVLRLALKKAPKYLHCILWAMVALRLICPDLPESKASLIPSSQPVSSAMSAVRENPTASDAEQMVLPSAEIPQIAVPQQTEPETVQWEEILTMVWLTGVAAMACYGVASYLLLRKKVAPAVSEDGVWLCDDVASPFILGIFRPRIYLPSGLDEDCRESVLAHEKAHLRRKDHWWKPLGFVLLAIHWFNPAMWLAYILLCRDIEAACDERVIKQMDEQARKRYSEALLSCAAPRRSIAACPLAFGEQGVKGRIKSVLSYKKPTIWLILIAVVVAVILAICFLTNPAKTEENILRDTMQQDGTPQDSAPQDSAPQDDIMTATIAHTLPSCLAFEEDCFYIYGTDDALYRVYWTDMDGLYEGQSVRITYRNDSKVKVEQPNPPGGWSPQYEITASRVEPEPDAAAYAGIVYFELYDELVYGFYHQPQESTYYAAPVTAEELDILLGLTENRHWWDPMAMSSIGTWEGGMNVVAGGKWTVLTLYRNGILTLQGYSPFSEDEQTLIDDLKSRAVLSDAARDYFTDDYNVYKQMTQTN